MPARVSPTDRVRAMIDELFAADRELPEILEEVARLGAQLLMQAALEAEVTEFLGRDRYQRAATTPEAQPGSRNGFQSVTVRAATVTKRSEPGGHQAHLRRIVAPGQGLGVTDSSQCHPVRPNPWGGLSARAWCAVGGARERLRRPTGRPLWTPRSCRAPGCHPRCAEHAGFVAAVQISPGMLGVAPPCFAEFVCCPTVGGYASRIASCAGVGAANAKTEASA